MKNAILATSLIASFVSAAVQTAHAEEAGKLTLETGMDYNTGKYGGTVSTDLLYVPFTAKYQGKEWTLRLTVPYIQVKGPASVISVMNGANLAGGVPSNIAQTRSGLGDIIGSASHNVYNGGNSGMMANLTGKVKLGTASLSQGLGTGQNDYALQTDVYQVKEKHTLFGTFGYKIYGSPPGYRLDNVFYGYFGDSYKFDQANSGGAMINLGQKVVPTGSAILEAICFVSHKLDNTWKVQGYFLKGFTNGVPDYGLGATIAHSL